MEVDFIEFPVSRGIMSVNTDLVDADILWAELGIDQYNNSIKVGPPLVQIVGSSSILKNMPKQLKHNFATKFYSLKNDTKLRI
jgi:hypothetical protein